MTQRPDSRQFRGRPIKLSPSWSDRAFGFGLLVGMFMGLIALPLAAIIVGVHLRIVP